MVSSFTERNDRLASVCSKNCHNRIMLWHAKTGLMERFCATQYACIR